MSPKYKFVPDKDYILWQLPQSSECTGMAYIISAADGRNFVVDGGTAQDKDMLLGHIREKCAGEIDAWFISHHHPGHAGALCELLSDMPEDIKISKIFHSHINVERVEKYEPESVEFVRFCNKLFKESGISVVSVNPGDRLKLGRTMIRVFSAGDAGYTEDYVNNLSVVYKFNMYCTSVLFLGDIMRDASINMLERYRSELNCDIIQMSNHGLNGVLSEVYALATPDICLWSIPERFTKEGTPEGDIFLENKRLLEALGAAEHYVSGVDGVSEIHISY